ncbi:hypothetical protein [Ornithinimicrobium kibberense]|uniref:hypothetical protein n=1 Tax=Ornithinimicrobium kibberense TaxID=282060 RepID=UPI003611B4B7
MPRFNSAQVGRYRPATGSRGQHPPIGSRTFLGSPASAVRAGPSMCSARRTPRRPNALRAADARVLRYAARSGCLLVTGERVHVGGPGELQLEPVVLLARSASEVRPRHGFGSDLDAGKEWPAADDRARTSKKRCASGLIFRALAKEKLGHVGPGGMTEVLRRINPGWCVRAEPLHQVLAVQDEGDGVVADRVIPREGALPDPELQVPHRDELPHHGTTL